MGKILVSGILLAVGVFVSGIWLSGSHGHLQFRPDYLEDWIFTALVVVCWGIPVFLFVYWIIKRKNQQA